MEACVLGAIGAAARARPRLRGSPCRRARRRRRPRRRHVPGRFRGGRSSLAGRWVYFVAGILVAVLGALLPRSMPRAPASRARLRRATSRRSSSASPVWPGLLLIASGAALAQLGPVRGLPLFGYAAIACLLVGAIALVPRIAELVFRYVPLPSHPPLRLALAQLRAAPGQAAVSLAAIVASFSLMAAMAIMVASFRQSVDDWLASVLPAEVYFRTTHAGDTTALDLAIRERVRALPQVARADFLRSGRIVLDPTRPPLVLIARDRAEKTFPLLGERYERRPGDPPAVWISEAVADLYGFSPGNRLELPMLNKTHSVVVAGVFRDYARQHGAVLIDRADYVALTGDRTANDGALWLAPGATPADVMEALRALPGGAQLDIAEPGEIREVSLRIFDRSFAVTYAMEAVAVLVGLFGLSSSLGAIVLARRREFGVLRHLGSRAADPRHAGRRRRPARARRLGRGPRRRRGDQPGARLRRQPPVVPLEHGASPAVPAPCRFPSWCSSRSRC